MSITTCRAHHKHSAGRPVAVGILGPFGVRIKDRRPPGRRELILPAVAPSRVRSQGLPVRMDGP
jgi:hypothetical protein